jgi:hypothetical protein
MAVYVFLVFFNKHVTSDLTVGWGEKHLFQKLCNSDILMLCRLVLAILKDFSNIFFSGDGLYIEFENSQFLLQLFLQF